MCEDPDGAANAAGREQPAAEVATQSVDHFIAQVIEDAKQRDDFDKSLLPILTTHVVKEEPADEGVDLAVAQIEALAEKRASASDQESADGRNHD